MTASDTLLDSLLELTRTLAQRKSLEPCLQAVTETALALLPCDHSSIRILDGSREQLLSGARSGTGKEARPVTFKRGEGVVGRVAETGETLVINDTGQDERFTPVADQGFEIGSILAIPLFSLGKVMGVFAATSAQTNAFADRDVDLAQLLAYTAVSPIEFARLHRLAMSDHKTQALNPRALQSRLKGALERAKSDSLPLSLLYIDLDHFRLVDNLHGHEIGDQVLSHVALRILNLKHASDLLIRLRGGEFVLVVLHEGAAQAATLAERIRRNLAEKPIALKATLEVSQKVSIGVVTWDGSETPQRLIQRAEQAAIQAKTGGRNRVHTA